LRVPLDSLAADPDAMVVDHDPFDLALRDAQVPEEHRALAARVRAGDTAVQWKDYLLVHVRNEDRIAPVEHQGGSYHEIDWITGERRRGVPLITRNRATGRYYSRLDVLHGGMRGGELEVMGVSLSERLTVLATESLLRRATDLGERRFADLFAQYFTIAAAEGATLFDARALFAALYRDSPTFRRLFNYASDYGRLATSSGGWTITIGQFARPVTKFEQCLIEIPIDAQIVNEQYLGIDGNNKLAHIGEIYPVRHEQVHLHEMVHALTGANDPLRSADLRHRGPVVYLTDKILSEAGYDLPQQAMYRRPNHGWSAQEPGYDWDNLLRAMEIENRRLDAIVDAKVPVSDGTRILESAVENRLTVQQLGLAFAQLSAGERDFTEAMNWRLNVGFEFPAVDAPGGTPDVRKIADVYRRFYNRSPLFRRLFDKLYDWTAEYMDGNAKWTFVAQREPAADALPAHVVHGVDSITRTVHLSSTATRYLSNEGIADLEWERRLAEAMVQILTRRGGVEAAAACKNRGAVVWLADRVLREAGYPYPRRIACATAAQSDLAAQRQLALHETAARRAASAEDRYLDSGSRTHRQHGWCCIGSAGTDFGA
jgi:hypothetical protein